jgi:cystathionine beta-lyase
VRFYDPQRPELLEGMIGDATALIWLESPASQTFEMQDVRAVTTIARQRGIATAIDNTWATGYFFRPLDLGVDISVLAATKYIGGHSDLMMGSISASGEVLARLKNFSDRYGFCVAGDDAYLALRGLRTLPVRLDRHYANGLRMAEALSRLPGVLRVMHPALSDDPGHALWQRDFQGASGLFGFVLEARGPETTRDFFNRLQLFGMGGSWGGYESLLIPTWPERNRKVRPWQPGGQTMRVHVGLEAIEDLVEDLTNGIEFWNAGA